MKRNKFNIGDEVRVLNGSGIKNYTGAWTYFMKEYVGKVAAITEIKTYSDGQIGYYLRDCDEYCFDERGLELVSGEKKAGISIYRKGNKVIALNEETGKTGVAKCSPDDSFDFMTGAKLALERLSECTKHKFKVGDRVIGNKAASERYSITKSGWVGEVVSVDEDGDFEAKGEGLFKKLSVFSCLSESCFDLCDRIMLGDKVKVTRSSSTIFIDVIEKVTALTKNDKYLARFAFGANDTGIAMYKTLGAELTVVAANNDYALVTAGDDKPVYIASTKDLIRC